MTQVAGHHRTARDELDQCLQVLEDAHERNETLVSAALCRQLQGHVPAIAPRMAIADAINLVFREQEKHLARRFDDSESRIPAPPQHPSDRPDLVADQLDEAEARALTERIKRTAQQVSLLLLEAHERRAWIALGYRSWEHYVRREFALSRPRSYELLDHGRLVRNIQRTTGLTDVASLTPYTVRRLKPHLAEFVDLIGRRVASTEMSQMPLMVREVIDTCLASPEFHGARVAPPSRRELGVERLDGTEVDGVAVLTAIDYLAQLPPARAVVDRVLGAGVRVGEVMCALEWLRELARELHSRHPVAD